MSGQYATVADLRAEHVTEAMADDARCQLALDLAADWIDAETTLFFDKRTGTWELNGTGTPVLEMPASPLTVTSVVVDGEPIDLGLLAVYGRRGTDDDDRRYPRIVIKQSSLTRLERALAPGLQRRSRAVWPKAELNVAVTGEFGVVTAAGETPPLIKRATMRLAVRHLTLVGDLTGADMVGGVLEGESLGNYSYSLGAAGAPKLASTPAFVGDPVVDEIIALFARVHFIAAAG